MSLSDVARHLNLTRPRRGRKRSLPSLILMTDALRLADPISAACALPRGSAVILRHYEMAERAALGRALAVICRRRGLLLLVAGDRRLAAAIGAGGLHLPEGAVREWPRGMIRRCGDRDWLVTAAAHSPAAIRLAARAGADAVLLAPVFATQSHPDAEPIGALRFARWCRKSPLPVYALGGVGGETARRLRGSGAAGIAGIGALIPSRRRGA
jgi:thiamine-phosphate pyrophosphorylase